MQQNPIDIGSQLESLRHEVIIARTAGVGTGYPNCVRDVAWRELSLK
jgi:hypothetical protein